MTVYSTLNLLSLQFKTFNLQNFELCLRVVTEVIITYPEIKGNDGMIGLITQSVSMFNRFFMINSKEILAFIESNVNLEQFLNIWIELLVTDIISSKKAQKISAVALLYAMSNLPAKFIIPKFTVVMQNIVREVFRFVDERTGQVSSNPMDRGHLDRSRGYSHRKAELRSLHMFNEVNLLSVFKETMAVRDIKKERNY